MERSLESPVLFLIFNRPEQTQSVFQEIRKAKPSRLYVAADGPRSHVQTDQARCAEAREILRRVDWRCTVMTLLREQNLGCKRAVSSALDWFFENEAEGIILEDDCLPEQSFFGFCQSLLEKYRDDERVMMIGGTNHLLDGFPGNESYLFSKYFNIWGWASWRRVWNKYDITMPGWRQRKRDRALNSFYSHKYVREYLTRSFDLAYGNKIDTWDIQFAYCCLFSGGLAAVPRVNLISNIGVAGTHSAGPSAINFTPVFPLDVNRMVHPSDVRHDEVFDNLLFERLFQKGIWKRSLLWGKDVLHTMKQLRRKSS